uniref:Tectonic family member 2 n=1 Tax=Varanus komodoensis TaxID=61221 RepID=A0A8D2LBM2_VARKO
LVTVHLNKTPHLCTENLTSCCSEEPCVLEALQVSACHGLKVVARLLIQAKIYANTSLGNMTGKTEDNATVIPNQVFQPLGSCPCNLTAGACDIRCCCDLECSSEMKQLFSGSCFRGVFGGDVNPPFDQMCSAHPGSSAPDWFPFLCVQSSLDNTPFLGYFYQGALSSREVSSFKIPFQTIPGKLFSGYKQGDPILNMQNEYFTIPQQFLAGQCARNAPIAFLRNVEAKCLATCKEAGSSMLDRAINSGTGGMLFQRIGRLLLYQSFASARPRPFLAVSSALMGVYETSQNPLFPYVGYQVGKPIRAANLNSSDLVTTLNLWKPDGKGSCASAGLTPLLFGLNSVSGCIEEVDLKDSCSQLRENVAKRLNSLVEVSHVGKRGNSNASVLDDWVEIIRLDTLGPNTNESFENLKGTCPDIPAHLNIQIITADVGAVEGIPQQEILGVQLSFSMVTWQVQCPIICEDKTSTLPISVAVQFIKIPVQPPVPMTRFQINYTEYDCRRNDVCWPELFYPLTRYYTGEPYSHSLAKGLVLVFFILIGVVLSVPWRND